MVANWPNNKNLPVSNDEIEITDANVISSVQIAALNETTDRSTSKPKAVIDGQDATGGGGSSTPHALGTNVDTTTGPFLSQHPDNITLFEALYDNNTAKFQNRVINGVTITDKSVFMNMLLGSQLTENIDVACIHANNASDASAAGVWELSQSLYAKAGGGLKTKDFFLPEGFIIHIIKNAKDADDKFKYVNQPNGDPPTVAGPINTLEDVVASSTTHKAIVRSDKNIFDAYLPSSLEGQFAIRHLNARNHSSSTTNVIKVHESPWASNNPSDWWVKLVDTENTGAYLATLLDGATGLRLNPDAGCIGQNLNPVVGWSESTTTVTTHGTPMVVADDKIEVDSSVLDPDNLPAPAQFTIDVPWDPVLLSNLATIFADPDDYTLLTGDIKVEVLKAAVTTAAGADAPPSIITHADKRPVELDSNGIPEENQYDEESVIPAINRVHKKTNQALGSAGQLDQYLTTTVIGNPNASRAHSPGDTTYEALTASGYDPTLTIALGRLNLIPILSGDRLIESVAKLDSDGNQVYTDLGIPETTFITQEQRAEMSPQARRDRFMLHPDSDKPPTKMLEALWTNWRHLSALTTDTYGISALTDVDIIDDKHELIEPLELNSFIQNFNLLYNMTDSLSASLEPIKHALSGEDPGDTLIEQLSSHSIYHNLNTLYTGVSANSACCEINSLSATSNRTDITNLSAFAVELEKRIGAGGGVSTCEGEDICSALTNLHDTIVNLNNPGGYVLCYPANGIEKHFKPDLAWQDTADCSDTVMPDSDVYRHYEDVAGGVDVVLYLWQEKATSDWYISSGDIDGKFQCSTDFSTKIANPDNKPLDELTLNNCDITPQPSPYPEFTEKINKVIEYVTDPPIIRNPVGRKDPVDIDALSACCDTNTLNLSALSSYVFGDPLVLLAGALKNSDGDDPNGLTDVVNILFQRILTLEESGGGDGDPQTIINKLNINILSGGLTSLSGDVIDLTETVNTNTTNISNNTTDINVLSGTITDLEECCDQSLKLDDIGNHAVLLTGGQSVSGEKIFKETLTVDTSAVIGENITVGSGDTVFSVCPDVDAGVSYVQIHDIITIDTGNPANALPDGAIYAMEVTGTDGILRKQLFIK